MLSQGAGKRKQIVHLFKLNVFNAITSLVSDTSVRERDKLQMEEKLCFMPRYHEPEKETEETISSLMRDY